MAAPNKSSSSNRRFTLTDFNRTLLGIQGALVMGIFVFFNTTYSLFAKNLASWGKYLIFPAFMATEILMAGIATYWHYKAVRELITNRSNLTDAQISEKLLLMDIRLAAIWLKTGLILMSGFAGLGVIPGAAAFSAPLMIAGLGLYALAALAIDIYEIHKKAQTNGLTASGAFRAYQAEINHKRNDLIGSFLLVTVLTCVAVANYIPDLVVLIPGLSPLSVLTGIFAGAATIALAYHTPGEREKAGYVKLDLLQTEQNNNQIFYKPGENINSNLANQRLAASGIGSSSSATHTQNPVIVKAKHTQEEINAMSDDKKALLGYSKITKPGTKLV